MRARIGIVTEYFKIKTGREKRVGTYIYYIYENTGVYILWRCVCARARMKKEEKKHIYTIPRTQTTTIIFRFLFKPSTTGTCNYFFSVGVFLYIFFFFFIYILWPYIIMGRSRAHNTIYARFYFNTIRPFRGIREYGRQTRTPRVRRKNSIFPYRVIFNIVGLVVIY